MNKKTIAFPSPLEVWVVSYQSRGVYNCSIKVFPSPLEVWVVSYIVIKLKKKEKRILFPSPLEVWVVSYPISCIPKGKQYTR